MGLDAHFYEKATPVKHPAGHEPDDDCWDNHLVVYAADFPDQADGIEHHSCLETSGKDHHISHSYSGYGQYRAWLCMGMFGVEPEKVWKHPDDFRDQPFYSQINFADNEGIIGPQTAARLAQDYAEQREHVVERWKALPRSFDVTNYDHQVLIENMIKRYDEWATGFALAADAGLVRFG